MPTRMTIQNRLGTPRKELRENCLERVVVDGDRVAVGHQQADAAQRGQRGQRNDEGRQAHLDDAEAMEEADRHADTASVGTTAIQTGTTGIDQHGEDDRAEANDRADRQVDAAGDDDEGLADREDGDHRTLTQQVGDVVGRCEARRRKATARSTTAPAAPAGSARTGRCSSASAFRPGWFRCSSVYPVACDCFFRKRRLPA